MPAHGSEQDTREVVGWVGGSVRDSQGRRMGRLEAVYVDRESLEVEWLALRSGRFAGRLVLVPRRGSIGGPGHVWLPLERDLIMTAPMSSADRPVSPNHERVLCDHYGIEPTRGARRSNWERRTALSVVRSLDDLAGVRRGSADGVEDERRRAPRPPRP